MDYDGFFADSEKNADSETYFSRGIVGFVTMNVQGNII